MQESDGYRRSELRAIVSIGFIAIDDLLRSDETRILERIQSTHMTVCQEACASFGGWVFRQEVNGVWCSFATANLALKALEYILNRLSGQIPQVRCGIHVGDVTLTPDGELLGHTLSVAKRLETQAKGEEICLSHESYDRLDRHIVDLYDWTDVGDTELKGVGHLGVWKAVRRTLKPVNTDELNSSDDAPADQVTILFDLRRSPRTARRDLLRSLYKSLSKGSVVCWTDVWVRAQGAIDKLLELTRPYLGQFRAAIFCLDVAYSPSDLGEAQKSAYLALSMGAQPLLLMDSRLESVLCRKPEPYFVSPNIRLNRFELAQAAAVDTNQDPFASVLSASNRPASPTPGMASGSATATMKIQSLRPTAPEEEFSVCLPVKIDLPLQMWRQLLADYSIVQNDLPELLRLALRQPSACAVQKWCVWIDLVVRRDSYGKMKNSSNLNRWQSVLPAFSEAYALLTQACSSRKRLLPDTCLQVEVGGRDSTTSGTFSWSYNVHGQVRPSESLFTGCESVDRLDVPFVGEELAVRPYQGWSAFSADRDVWFFGREKQCSKISTALEEQPWLVLYGRTGVGKTSFLKSGLYCELCKPGDTWIWVSRWTQPSLALVLQLESLLDGVSRSSPAKAVRLAAQQTSGRLYLVFDQFEEFFVDTEPSERSRFTASLYSLMSSVVEEWDSWGHRVRMVFSLREDRLPEFSALEANLPGLLDCLYRLRPLTSDQARDAIQMPAALSGIRLSEGLVEAIVEDLGGDAVSPSELSICLHRLWVDYLERHELFADRLVPGELQAKSTRMTSGEFLEDIQKSDYWRLGGAAEILENALQDSIDHIALSTEAGLSQPQCRESMLKILQDFAQGQSNSGAKRSLYRNQAQLLTTKTPEAERLATKLLLRFQLLETVAQGTEIEHRLAQDSMLNEIYNWVQNEQLSQRYAQLSLEEEHTSWTTQGTAMTRERFYLVEEYRDGLLIGDSERHLLLQTAALLQEPLGYWMQQGDAEFLLQFLTSSIEGSKPVQNQIRRHVLLSLFELPLTDAQVERALVLCQQVGNPDWIDRLACLEGSILDSPQFWAKLRTTVGERFFGPQAMVTVLSGAFWFGSSAENKLHRQLSVPRFLHDSIASESNLELKELGEFLMDRFPVTHDLFSEFRTSHLERYPEELGSHPVVSISYYDAMDFAKWLGKELPTELEWEKASRGSDGRLYPWGDEYDSSLANCRASQRRRSTSVSAYPQGASPCGCLDMAGNVWEWTSSDFGLDMPFKVQKGGSCINSWELLQCSSRRDAFPDFVLELVGFRLKASTHHSPMSSRGRFPK